ncbi:MAG: CPBP family glutamic-type intramembrane protease [Acidimicrobiales bacterium]
MTLGVIGFTVGMFVVFAGALGWWRQSVLDRKGVTVAAVVHGSSFGRLIKVSYRTADGRTFSARVSDASWFTTDGPRASTVTVVYDPDDPSVVALAGTNGRGAAVVECAVGVAIAALGILGLVGGWRRADRPGAPVMPGAATGGGPPLPGWYADPWWPPAWRWWSGAEWTPFARPDQPTSPPRRPVARTLPIAGAAWAVGGFVLSYALASGGALGLRAAGAPVMVRLVVSEILLWTVLLAACVTASRRWGSGDWRADYGFRLRWRDLWSGVGAFWLMTAAAVLAAAPLLGHRSLQGTNTGAFSYFRHSSTDYVLVAVIAVVGAPIVEELFFRGFLLEALASRLRVGGAVVVQGVLFGLAHTNPALGSHNISVVAGIGAMGIVLGLAAAYYRRLGPGMVAHGLHNLVTLVVILSLR